MRGIWTVAVLGLALVGACGGGSEAENAKKKFQAACEAVCDRAYNPPCQGLTVEQCKSACPYLEEQLGEACLSEYADLYSCASGAAYECTDNGPQPVSVTNCASEALAAEQCQQTAPCKTYCKTKNECDGTDTAACESECSAALADEAPCGYRYEDVVDCQSKGGLVCTDGKLQTVGCDNDVQDYGDCLANDDLCQGFCYMADFVGCSTQSEADCNTSCTADLSAAEAKGCSQQFSDFRRCQLGHGLPCKDGEPSIQGCSEELYFYQTCMGIN